MFLNFHLLIYHCKKIFSRGKKEKFLIFFIFLFVPLSRWAGLKKAGFTFFFLSRKSASRTALETCSLFHHVAEALFPSFAESPQVTGVIRSYILLKESSLHHNNFSLFKNEKSKIIGRMKSSTFFPGKLHPVGRIIGAFIHISPPDLPL